MKEAIKQLEHSYKVLDETYNSFKAGTVGIEMLIAVSQYIAKQQKIVNKLTNKKNKRNGIISEIPE